MSANESTVSPTHSFRMPRTFMDLDSHTYTYGAAMVTTHSAA